MTAPPSFFPGLRSGCDTTTIPNLIVEDEKGQDKSTDPICSDSGAFYSNITVPLGTVYR
jgi:hypothetical protein